MSFVHVVHSCGQYRKNTVMGILQAEENLGPLFPIHRLDRLVSGLLIFARNSSAAERFRKDVQGGKVEKEYFARVIGVFPEEEVEVSAPVLYDPKEGHSIVETEIPEDDPRHRQRQARKDQILSNGAKCKDARTRFKRRSTDGETSIVSCMPLTGRTHQIRVHLQYLGHPIANDALYLRSDIDNPLRKRSHARTNADMAAKKAFAGGESAVVSRTEMPARHAPYEGVSGSPKPIIETSESQTYMAPAALSTNKDDGVMEGSRSVPGICVDVPSKSQGVGEKDDVPRVQAEKLEETERQKSANLHEVRGMSAGADLRSMERQGGAEVESYDGNVIAEESSANARQGNTCTSSISLDMKATEESGVRVEVKLEETSNASLPLSGSAVVLEDKSQKQNSGSSSACTSFDRLQQSALPVLSSHMSGQELQADDRTQAVASRAVESSETSVAVHQTTDSSGESRSRNNCSGSAHTQNVGITQEEQGEPGHEHNAETRKLRNGTIDAFAFQLDPLCTHCPSLAPSGYEEELEGLWLHCTRYAGPSWSYQCPLPSWAL
ncbi:hypothetical protein CBR_g48327 [Chara braunii]|uniref:Pseudouridine synthase RsuA/RluA-like domain-containing protein n=1 Tax=Chara braunii TaxID=69332 RepID=A0A388K4C4_CHABU|nr:hypothetical protein CBR_g48327 [Chara braunii]|eukprot:GBG64859.1 hypothetical protein CBR_g48327 [Chara braunii]